MTARTVIGSNGKPRRFVLTQPPGYRTGQTAPLSAPACPVEKAAVQALRRSDSERDAHYYTTGRRPVTTI